MWDNVEEVLDAFEQDDFLKIKGLINKYKNRFQLTIHKLRKLGDSEIEFDDYLPKTTKNIDDLWRTLAAFVVSFQNPYLRSLLQAFMADPEIAASYRNAPAAKTLHHAYIGGLLDHVVSLFRSVELISQNYPQINRDLLLAGVFLHDIGKIHEGPTAGPHGHRTGDAARQDRSRSRLPRRAEDAPRAPHHQPSRPVRVRLSEIADVP